MKRGRVETLEWTFDAYGRRLNDAPDNEPADLQSIPADVQLLVEEARIGCTSGMLPRPSVQGLLDDQAR